MFDFTDDQEEGHTSAEQSDHDEASREEEEDNEDLEIEEKRMVTIVVSDLVAEGNSREEVEVEGVNLVTTNMMPGFKAN